MRFRAQHRFRAPVRAVADLLVDAPFHQGLQLPDVELLEVVDRREDGERARLSLRYEYVGRLDPAVQRLLDGRRLTWLQEVAVDREAGEGRLTFAAEGSPDRLHGSADFALRAEPDGTAWELEGELRVRVPLVGGAAERRVVAGLLRRLEVEARHMADRLRTDA